MKNRQDLTARQKLFALEYLKDLNATQAAIRAGYSEKGAEVTGFNLLRNTKVAAEIQAAMDRRAEKLTLTSDYTLRAITNIGHFDPRKLFDEKGNMKEIPDLDADTARNIAGFEFVTLYDGSGDQKHAFGHLRKIRLRDIFNGLGPALVLSIFSFVGFEGATTLGGEVRDPLRTIPRAVMQCALLAGGFFMLCAYSEVLGFRGQAAALSSSTSPLHMLAAKAHVSPLGIAIDCGAFVSMFACVLACATAAARVLLRMAHDKLLPAALQRTSPRHGTPGAAVALSIALMFAATTAMALLGDSGSTMYDLLGSLSVFGFLTAYALVALALPFARRAVGQHSQLLAAVSALTVAVILMIAVFDLNSAEDLVHARIPYLYLAYITAGLAWYVVRRRKAQTV